MVKGYLKKTELSVVIPLYNEAENILRLIKALNQLHKSLPSFTELIFVDDGSTDSTVALLQTNKIKISNKILCLSRNFGHQSALLAGLREAKGKYVVTLDGDLQHPLEIIPQMVKQHRKGIDIVLTKRVDQGMNTQFKMLTAHWFYTLINRLSSTPIIENASDFRSMNRRALNALLAMPEHRQFLRGMVNWIGFSSIVIPFRLQKRVAGKSKYSLHKMIRLALYGLTSFSTTPLYFAGFFSFILFISAFFYAIYVIYVKLFTQQAVSGWTSLLFVLLSIGGFLCLFLSIIGVYTAAIYDEVKHRPIYIVKDLIHNS